MKLFRSILLVSLILFYAQIIFPQELFKAIRSNDLTKVKLLISNNSELLNIPSESQILPLTYASRLGNNEIVKYLISEGADVNPESKVMFSPLFYAVQKGHSEVAQTLIDNGANLNCSYQGMSLLHTAVLTRNKDILDLLISDGLNVNLKDNYGITPLHIAAELGLYDICKYLLLKGANLNIRSNDGSTPLHLAVESNQQEICRLLKDNGAKEENRDFPVITGKYLGANSPVKNLELFSPNSILRIIGPHSGIAISKDGKEIFWVRGDYSGNIWYTKEKNEIWSVPKIAPFSGNGGDSYPCFSGDGNRLFFTSDRSLVKGEIKKEGLGDIWYAEKTGEGWSEAINAGPAINTDSDEFIATLSNDNTIYFTRFSVIDNKRSVDIYKSEYINNKYIKAIPVSDAINSPAMEIGPVISPDGSYLIFESDRNGDMSIYLSFKSQKEEWTSPVDIKHLYKPYSISYTQGITSDGRYIIFALLLDNKWSMYWGDTEIIRELNPNRN